MSFRDQTKGGWSGETYRSETWYDFDRLPRGLKRVYWEAAYLYTAQPAVEMHLYDGVDPRVVAEVIAASFAADVAREVRRLYGPSHPQAVRR